MGQHYLPYSDAPPSINFYLCSKNYKIMYQNRCHCIVLNRAVLYKKQKKIKLDIMKNQTEFWELMSFLEAYLTIIVFKWPLVDKVIRPRST